ncbi:MAG: hypothetical protein JRC89_13445 [Deltaproteobacteria bacterium]|nr:hypothetical protein [Deltaproteobacteria bacterium]
MLFKKLNRTAVIHHKILRAIGDLMLYLLWHSGLYTNQQIGELFGLSYSSVSRRAALTHKRIREDVNLKKKFNN